MAVTAGRGPRSRLGLWSLSPESEGIGRSAVHCYACLSGLHLDYFIIMAERLLNFQKSMRRDCVDLNRSTAWPNNTKTQQQRSGCVEGSSHALRSGPEEAPALGHILSQHVSSQGRVVQA